MFKFIIEQGNIAYADILQNQVLNAHFLFHNNEFCLYLWYDYIVDNSEFIGGKYDT